MFRKLCMLIAISVAMLGALFAPSADAQGSPTCVGILFAAPIDDPPEPTPTPSATPTAVETDNGPVVGVANADPVFITEGCAEALAYPGPFTNMPVTPTSPFAAPHSIAAPPVSPVEQVVTAPNPGSDLAHSGSEIVVLGYLGTGLLAFGAVALGLRRGGFVE